MAASRYVFPLQRPRRPQTPVPAIYTGFDSIFGLCSDGRVLSIGSNKYGQCEVSHWQNIVALELTAYHTVGLRSDGTVVVAGGRGTQYKNKPIAQFRTESWRDIVAIRADRYHLVGLRSDGTVVATGSDREYSGKPSPMLKVGAWRDIVSIHVSEYATIGLRSDGTVVGTGSNSFGADRGLSAMSGVSRLIVNTWNTFALDASGNVIHVAGLNDDLCARGVREFYQGPDYSLLLHRDGTVACIPGQDPEYAPDVSQVRDVKDLADSGYCVAFLHSDRTVSLLTSPKGKLVPNAEAVASWKNVTQLCLYGEEYLLALCDDGSVKAACAPNHLAAQTAGWKLCGSLDWRCPRCGKQGLTGRFCPECGTPRP